MCPLGGGNYMAGSSIINYHMDESEQGGTDPNPRKRQREMMSEELSHSTGSLDGFIDFAFDEKIILDIKTKRAAQKMSPSVVSVLSSTGDKEFYGSGTIIESGGDGRGFFAAVLTSAHVVPFPESLRHDIKINVRLPNGEEVLGSVRWFDHHYNIALVDVQTKVQLTVATLRPLDDSLEILADNSSSHDSYQKFYKLYPGDKVVILGRAHKKPPFQAIAFSGEYCVDSCRHDCKQLLRLNGRILPPFSGGPVINSNGEVIGLANYSRSFIPFLPMNPILKWLDAKLNKSPFHRPSLGMEFTNLCSTRICRLGRLARLFPNNFTGIIVEFVTPKSAADLAGLKRNDIIVECDGEIVRGNLQFHDP